VARATGRVDAAKATARGNVVAPALGRALHAPSELGLRAPEAELLPCVHEVKHVLVVHLHRGGADRAHAGRAHHLEHSARKHTPVSRRVRRFTAGFLAPLSHPGLDQTPRRAEHRVRLTAAGLAVGHERAVVSGERVPYQRRAQRVVRHVLVRPHHDGRGVVKDIPGSERERARSRIEMRRAQVARGRRPHPDGHADLCDGHRDVSHATFVLKRAIFPMESACALEIPCCSRATHWQKTPRAATIRQTAHSNRFSVPNQ
jgi:hypothetical protein